MAKCFLSTETKDELHYLKSKIIAMSRCLPDATSLPQEQVIKTCMVSAVRIEVFSIKHS